MTDDTPKGMCPQPPRGKNTTSQKEDDPPKTGRTEEAHDEGAEPQAMSKEHAQLPRDHRIYRPARFLASTIPVPSDADIHHDAQVEQLVAAVQADQRRAQLTQSSKERSNQ